MRRFGLFAAVLVAVGCQEVPLGATSERAGGDCVPAGNTQDLSWHYDYALGPRDVALLWVEPGMVGEVALRVELLAVGDTSGQWRRNELGECVAHPVSEAILGLTTADGQLDEVVDVTTGDGFDGSPLFVSGSLPLAELAGHYQPTSFKATAWDDVTLRVHAALVDGVWVGDLQVRAVRQGTRDGVGESFAGQIAVFGADHL